MHNLAVIIRSLVFAAFIGLAGWWSYYLKDKLDGNRLELEARDQQIESLTDDLLERDERIDELGQELAESYERIQALELSMWLLKVNHRVARVEVIEQGPSSEDPDTTVTRVRFVELGPDGELLGPAREIELQGKVLYVEGLVIKFEDDFIEGGDVLRGSSVAIFKRVFSENQAPNEGVAIDRPRMHPLPHRDEEGPDPFYEDLWERFWDYANDPDLAATKGVRAMHGEAPSIELREGKSYRVELRASGGLTIRPED